ncbi:MAG TPA: hypothetical protein VNY70_01485 [Steroidobacteraceae bacterium]|nr:hypothetical protein [Steroidobacteraceae bacterium]
MHSMRWARSWVFAAALALGAASSAASPPAATVEFAPAVAAKMQGYGEDQRAPLEKAVLAAVAYGSAKCPAVAGLEIAVTVEDAAPTHPTPAQLAAEPALSPTRSKYLGGARLRGEVRDASHHVLAEVQHEYFAPTLGLGSSSLDPWADARLAIDQFGFKLTAACRALPRG